MKKKKLVLSVLCVALICVLLSSLTACMKIGMRQENVVKKLTESGATIRYERNTPMTKDGQNDQKLGDLIYSTKTFTETVDGEESEVVRELYVIFAGNDSSADWAEKRCKDYVSQNAETLEGWQTYRYDRVILCGHYKGVDQRVRDHLITKEYTIGDFVLTGGEMPAAMMTDAIVRLLPGALGDETSALSDSFQDGLLEPGVYTRPAEYKGWRVPDILLSGNQAKIEEWLYEESIRHTRERRPDLLDEE